MNEQKNMEIKTIVCPFDELFMSVFCDDLYACLPIMLNYSGNLALSVKLHISLAFSADEQYIH